MLEHTLVNELITCVQREPCDTSTKCDPDDVTGGREEVLAVVGVGGGG